MPELSPPTPERAVEVCRENAAAIAESLSQCFDQTYRVEVGDLHHPNMPEIAAILAGPGLAVAFEVGGHGILCAVPASLPLPDWYRQPGDSEQSRLQTLAMEWSLNLLPDDADPSRFAAVAVENLHQHLGRAGPAADGTVLELLVSDSSRPAANTEPARLFLVWPLTKPAPLFETPAVPPASPQPPTPMTAAVAPAPQLRSAAPPAASTARQVRGKRLLNLPVTVIVRLAEKKIEVGQLISLSPGALITFNKSCEDLLDLYVNNHLYCRGEAVKIGEKFGLKVNELGTKPVRERRVINS